LSDHNLRRALRRAADGRSVSKEEALALLSARGNDLSQLAQIAKLVRDQGLAAKGRPGVVTYSPKVFIPLTHLCRDTCHYCTFARSPAQLRAEGLPLFLEVNEAVEIARRGAEKGALEALFTLGDSPEARWPAATDW